MSYTDPGSGLTVQAKVRGLVAHEDTDYREWGASGALRVAPGHDGRGLTLTVAPAWGAAEGGAERLWSHRDARAFAPDGETERGYGAGYAYRVGDALDLGLDARRRDAAGDDAPVHEIVLRARMRW